MKAAQKAGVAAELKALMLAEPKLTLAVAESLTAGNVQAQIAGVSGASGYFLGGVTAYSIEEKVRLLGVNRAGAKKVNCVSARVAEEMARGAAELLAPIWRWRRPGMRSRVWRTGWCHRWRGGQSRTDGAGAW